mgnify:CR=1 FL=1
MRDKPGVDQIIHSGDIYDALNTDMSDLPFYEKLCKSIDGPVLELCCGTGRLTIPLAQAGIHITGLDLEESMLNRAKEKAQKANMDIPLHQGDIRSFDLNKKYAFVFIPFNSLQNIYTWTDVELVFQCVKKHLEPNALFCFDIFNPDIKLMVDRSGPPEERYQCKLDDGRELSISEQCEYLPDLQINRVTWDHRIGDEIKSGQLDMRCYYPLEMDACLRYNSWSIEAKYGNFDESDFTGKSPKQIYLCRSL